MAIRPIVDGIGTSDSATWVAVPLSSVQDVGPRRGDVELEALGEAESSPHAEIGVEALRSANVPVG